MQAALILGTVKIEAPTLVQVYHWQRFAYEVIILNPGGTPYNGIN